MSVQDDDEEDELNELAELVIVSQLLLLLELRLLAPALERLEALLGLEPELLELGLETEEEDKEAGEVGLARRTTGLPRRLRTGVVPPFLGEGIFRR